MKKETITILRVFATISVAVGHLAADNQIMIEIFKFIYSYHIPLFMFISGYCYDNSLMHYNNIEDVVAAKAVRLLIPYYVGMCTAILPTHLIVVKDVQPNLRDVLYYLENNISSEHLWYLMVLFWISVVWFPIIRFKSKKTNILCLVVLGVLFSFPITSFVLILRYSFYFLLGIVICEYEQVLYKYTNVFSLGVLGILVFAGQIFIQIRYESYVGAWFISCHLHSYLVISTITIIFLYSLSSFFNRGVHFLCATKIVKLIDGYSFDIYIYHLICAQLIETIFINRIMMVVTDMRIAGIARKIVLLISMIFVPIIIISLIQNLKDKMYKKNNLLWISNKR